MMRLLLLWLLLSGAVTVTGGELTSDPYSFGVVEGLPFRLGYFGPNWTGYTETGAKTLIFPGEGGETLPGGGVRRCGTFDVGIYGKFDYCEVKKVGENRVAAELKLSASPAVATESLALQLVLPLEVFAGRRMTVDGKPFMLGGALNNWRIQTAEGRHTVAIPMQRGVFRFSSTCRLLLQDNRRFGRHNFSLRVIMPGTSGKVRETGLRIEAEYEPYPVTELNLKTGTSARKFGGIPFAVANSGPLPAAGLTLQVPERMAYLYLLSRFEGADRVPRSGEVHLVAADGSTRRVSVAANSGGEIFFAPGTDKIYSFPVDGGGKLYLTRVPLGSPTPVGLRFSASGSWRIAAVSASSQPLVPDYREGKYVVKAGPDWIPFRNELDIEAGSALDFSGLLDAPAGKHGFVTTRGEHFVFTQRPGAAVRFWGTNVTGNALFMDNADIDRLVRRLAMCGYNLVRIHHFDARLTEKSADSTVIDPEKLDRLDYFIAACKKRGIYISLDLFTSRKTGKGEFADFPGRELSMRDYKSLLMINESVMRNLERFTANLLTHRNRYTGLAWTDEPAIANLSLINEGVLYNNIRSDFVHQAFRRAGDDYLRTHPGADRQQFLHDVYARGYRRMAGYVRRLGVKVPLTDLNYTLDHVSVFFDRRQLDYVDIHCYWAHPDRLGVPRSFRGDSALNAYTGMASLFGARFLDRPFAVTEWSFVFPNAWRSEGGFLAGAYFSLQGYAMPCRFNYASNPRRAMTPTIIVGFEQVSDPVSILGDRAGALFYLRRDVQEARETCAVLLQHEKSSIPAEMQILGLIFKTGCVFTAAEADRATCVVTPGAADPAVKAPQFATNRYPDLIAGMKARGILPESRYNRKTQQMVSSTGELYYDGKKRTFTALTPRSEGFVGGPGTRGHGKFADVEITDTFASVLVASLNGEALPQSRRMLLLHLTDCQNTDMCFSDSRRQTVENYGRLPVLLRRGQVRVTLNAPATGAAELYELALSGKRLRRIPVERNAGKLNFVLDNSQGALAYELIIADRVGH